MIGISTKSSGWPTEKDLNDLAEAEVKEIIGDFFRLVVKLSPVYSGAFRASWRVSFNEMRTDVTEGYTPASPIRGAAFRWPKGFKLGDTVIVSNNQPYAEGLEYGASNQAPYGVVRVALAAMTFK